LAPSHTLHLLEVRANYKNNTSNIIKDKIDTIINSSIDWVYDSIKYYHVSDIRDMIKQSRAMKKKISFKQLSGLNYRPQVWQVFDYCGIGYRSFENTSRKVDENEYLEAIREAIQQGY
jgi:hypothetical protein